VYQVRILRDMVIIISQIPSNDPTEFHKRVNFLKPGKFGIILLSSSIEFTLCICLLVHYHKLVYIMIQPFK
jgi:hypothetical protein